MRSLWEDAEGVGTLLPSLQQTKDNPAEQRQAMKSLPNLAFWL